MQHEMTTNNIKYRSPGPDGGSMNKSREPSYVRILRGASCPG